MDNFSDFFQTSWIISTQNKYARFFFPAIILTACLSLITTYTIYFFFFSHQTDLQLFPLFPLLTINIPIILIISIILTHVLRPFQDHINHYSIKNTGISLNKKNIPLSDLDSKANLDVLSQVGDSKQNSNNASFNPNSLTLYLKTGKKISLPFNSPSTRQQAIRALIHYLKK